MVPPRFVRRLVFAPLLVAITLVVLAASPLLLLVGLIAGRGRHRLLRILAVAVTWLALETAVLFACLWLWAAGGFRARTAAYRERHYALCGWFLRHVYAVGRRAFDLDVEIQEPLNAATDRPVIVLSRHAGPGDSFLIVHHLISVYGRRPCIVLKTALRLDPALDVLLGRLPNAFLPSSAVARGQAITEIARLAAGLDSRSAMLIFPEGGNFTPRRRVRAIRRLRREGHLAEARRARQMPNVLPPQLAGTLAAIDAAPGADIVFVAHTGVDDLLSAGDIWRRMPMDQPLRARWWRVPHEEIPAEDRERWMYEWWGRVDEWIAENRPRTAAK
ncbi:MAG: 1-acyl-sn-glycerol-3-phosphate acyltransferase [Actinoallomurus sp.]